MINRLRLYSTFTLSDYEAATGLSKSSILPILELALKKQLMNCIPANTNNTDNTENTDKQHSEEWQVSKLGHRYLNDLLEMFL